MRVLVIGLDGGTWDIYDHVIKKGWMPFLEKLKAESHCGILMSTIPPFTIPAWASFAPGKNPGKHGVFSFFKRDPKSYHMDESGTFVSSKALPKDKLWQLLSKAGKRMAAINVPLTFPAEQVNGIMITGMLTPSKESNFVYPEELKAELDDYVIDLDFLKKDNRFNSEGLPDKEDILKKLEQLLESRLKTSLEIYAKEKWDFFMTVFTATDRLHHFYWDNLFSEKTDESGKFEPFFQKLDNALRAHGDSGPVMIFSDHGFGKGPVRKFHFNAWLRKIGLLFDITSGKSKISLKNILLTLGKNESLRRLIPNKIKTSLKQNVQGERKNLIDWSLTKAYFVPMYANYGGIELNIKGLKSKGIVDSGSEKEELLEFIKKHPISIVNPENGENLVKNVYRRSEIYLGPEANRFPDLIFEIDDTFVCSNSLVEEEFVSKIENPHRRGEHRP